MDPRLDDATAIGNLREDTAVRPREDGRFAGNIPACWKIAMAHGGVAVSAALQALAHRVAPERSLVSASASFLRPHPVGPFTAATEILRDARTVTFGQVDLRPGDGEDTSARVVAVYSTAPEALDRPALTRAFPRDALPLEEAAGLPHPTQGPLGAIMAALPFIQQQERRLALGTPPDAPSFAPREPRIATWTRFRSAPRTPDGRLDPIAFACLGDDNMAYFQHTGPPGVARVMITLQLDLQCFATTHSEWLLSHGSARHADDHTLHSEVELWDPDETLLAVVTQRALLK